MNVPDQFRAEVPEGSLEIRSTPGRAEARAADDMNGPHISGLGSPYGETTRLGYWWQWDETVAVGAWSKTIARDDADIRSMFNHDPNWLLGRTTADTLTLSDGDDGLTYDVAVNVEDTNAMSVWHKVDRGDVSGASVWFRVISERWTEPADTNDLEVPLREILEAELFEVGPVVFPAFVTTTAASTRSIDAVLRSAGVTRGARRAAITAELLSDPAGIEQRIRELFARRPDIRQAACDIDTEAAAVTPEGSSRSHLVLVRQRHLELAGRRATDHGVRS